MGERIIFLIINLLLTAAVVKWAEAPVWTAIIYFQLLVTSDAVGRLRKGRS